MIKKIKQYFLKKKQSKAQKKQLVQLQKYYETLRAGASFIQFIREDLAKSQNVMNRHQRRRLQKTILKGELNKELIDHYQKEIDRVLNEVNNRLKSKKQ